MSMSEEMQFRLGSGESRSDNASERDDDQEEVATRRRRQSGGGDRKLQTTTEGALTTVSFKREFRVERRRWDG
ncbi:hypothetical protein E3N88_20033 [Mikania micrantha]|uniref:Uncharacterized protein n=1 Tax=Mikania micrantha TaxID=192012 RepID=A0A5N6NHK7_9ASTR|nr:hypothetical protein E3N88_20033 [Mikania micrantha]